MYRNMLVENPCINNIGLDNQLSLKLQLQLFNAILRTLFSLRKEVIQPLTETLFFNFRLI